MSHIKGYHLETTLVKLQAVHYARFSSTGGSNTYPLRLSRSLVTVPTELSYKKHGKHIDWQDVIFLRRHFRSGAHNIMAARVSRDWILGKRQQ
jgi:uncharacterized protein YjlB